MSASELHELRTYHSNKNNHGPIYKILYSRYLTSQSPIGKLYCHQSLIKLSQSRMAAVFTRQTIQSHDHFPLFQ